MIEENCETLILVLTSPFSEWVPDINTPNTKTITYKYRAIQFRTIIYRISYVIRLVIPLLTGLSIGILSYLTGIFRKRDTTSIRQTGQRQQKVLFVATTQLYERPALAICNECVKNGITTYFAPYSKQAESLFRHHRIEYSKNIRLISLVSFAFHIGKVLILLFRTRKYVQSFHFNKIILL